MNCELRSRKADCQNGCKQHAKTTFHNKQVALVCCVKLCEHNFIICCFSTACCVNCMSVTSCCVSPTACCVKLCERYIMLLDVALARRRVRVEWQRENVLVVFFPNVLLKFYPIRTHYILKGFVFCYMIIFFS